MKRLTLGALLLAIIFCVSDAFAFGIYLNRLPTGQLSCNTCHTNGGGSVEMPLDLLFNDWAEISPNRELCRVVMVTVSVTVQSFWTRIAPGCGVSLNWGNATNPGNDMDPPQCVANLGCPCRNAMCDAGLACEGDVCVEAELSLANRAW